MNIISPLVLELLATSEKFAVIDCGARGGGESMKWRALGDRVVLYGFDPDRGECERLNAWAKSQGLQHFYFPCCLAKENCEAREFYVTRQVDSSSLYRPNEPMIRRWKSLTPDGKPYPHLQNLALDRTTTVKTISLDSWAQEYGISGVDFIKLDVQGAEVDILEGAQTLVLPQVLGLEVEVEFTHLYVDQPLFADVDPFVRGHGFTFFQFLYTHNGHFAGRMASPLSVIYEAPPLMMRQMAGQLVTADALYFRDLIAPRESEAWKLLETKAMKLACIAEVYGQIEFALELLCWARDLARTNGDPHRASALQEIVARVIRFAMYRKNS